MFPQNFIEIPPLDKYFIETVLTFSNARIEEHSDVQTKRLVNRSKLNLNILLNLPILLLIRYRWL